MFIPIGAAGAAGAGSRAAGPLGGGGGGRERLLEDKGDAGAGGAVGLGDGVLVVHLGEGGGGGGGSLRRAGSESRNGGLARGAPSLPGQTRPPSHHVTEGDAKGLLAAISLRATR